MDRMKQMLASADSEDGNLDLIPRIARGQDNQSQEPPDKKQCVDSPPDEVLSNRYAYDSDSQGIE